MVKGFINGLAFISGAMKLGNLELYWPNVLIFVLTLAWAMMMFIAPLSQPHDTIDLGNMAYVSPKLDNEAKYQHIDNYVVRRVYESGDRNCHQHSDRSIFINGNQMPYCARCISIFVGMAVGAFISMLIMVRVDWKWVVAGLVPMGIDGGIQLVFSYESNNILRILTGLPAGLITTLALGAVLYEVSKMFEIMRSEKLEKLRSEGKPPPRFPFWLRSAAIVTAILLGISGLGVGDYLMHDGYKETPEQPLAFSVYDAPFSPNSTYFIASDDLMVLTHQNGPNLDWEKVEIILDADNATYALAIEKINGEGYSPVSNHITGKGDSMILTLQGSGILPKGMAVSVQLLSGEGVIWASKDPVILQ